MPKFVRRSERKASQKASVRIDEYTSIRKASSRIASLVKTPIPLEDRAYFEAAAKQEAALVNGHYLSSSGYRHDSYDGAKVIDNGSKHKWKRVKGRWMCFKIVGERLVRVF